MGLVRDPDGHTIRFGQGISPRHPKLKIKRVTVEARLEKRLAAVLNDLTKQTDRTMGEVLEETILHSFEPSTACPHSNATLRLIEKLKKKHGLDYDVHATYRFAE